MSNARSVKTYMAIDASVFAFLLCAFEFINVYFACGMFSSQLYTVSATAGICCIVYMRWGWLGGIHAALGGIVWCAANLLFGTSVTGERLLTGLQFYLIYGTGNLLSLITVVLIKRIGKDRVVKSVPLCALFAALTQLLMQTGRLVIAVIFGCALGDAIGYITTDILSVVFTLLIVLIARRIDGLYEDQIHYLRRFRKEQAYKEQNL